MRVDPISYMAVEMLRSWARRLRVWARGFRS
jgi:hypothetical protein